MAKQQLSYAPVHILSEAEKLLAEKTRKALRKKGNPTAMRSDHEILSYIDGLADGAAWGGAL